MTAILGQAQLGSLVLGQGASPAPDVNRGTLRRVRLAPQLAPWGGRARRAKLPNTGLDTPPDVVLILRNRKFRPVMDPVPYRGRSRRTRPPLPDDLTPIFPPKRRGVRGDPLPPDHGSRATRTTPKNLTLPDPPAAPKRRLSSVWPFVPPGGSHRRGRPILSDIGPSTPVEKPRRARAALLPFPGSARRRRLPVPDPEPQVLPPRRVRAASPAMGVLWVGARPRPRRLFLSAAASPAPLEACPYRPHAQDEAEPQARTRIDEADANAPGRPDEGDSFPSRIDECP
jgi:hypothetical protein